MGVLAKIESLPVGFPRPLPTRPDSFKSTCQLSVSPALFLMVNAKTPLACLMAALRSLSEPLSTLSMASKALLEGNLSAWNNDVKSAHAFLRVR